MPSGGPAEEHLKLLAIFHWVVAAFALVMSLFSLIYIAMGLAVARGAFPFAPTDSHRAAPAPPEFVGWIFLGVGLVLLVCGLSFAVALAFAGVSLSHRQHWTYCMVMAGLACALFPFGTALGVFSIITLSRPEVRSLFGGQQPSSA